MLTRPRPRTEATFERGRSAEQAVDGCPERREDADARNPAERDVVERATHVGAAGHCREEHQHDEPERRRFPVLRAAAEAAGGECIVLTQTVDVCRSVHFSSPNR
ncbi:MULTISPECIES: hypothetical protein [unclassified Caballeronia]|uniref:hypothetical protein n=1 Tax=unclassified Caballeronia TaxID=2646786 RepID=UPI0028573218|nr:MULTISPECIES: hypothetical protein [unclassified Caballeronia]MDR5739298.1 hypothetical protein [Caballeronia sp. LZ016]MDR5807787.1 hypothetical protein [Caballeronia sp. LZ019]